MLRICGGVVTVLAALLLVDVCAAQSSNPYGKLPVTQMAEPLLMLIRDPIVQSELAISTAQKRSIRQLSDKYDSTLWKTRNQPAQAASENFNMILTSAKRDLPNVLTSDQLRRLGQIELWTRGMKAFSRDDFAQRLSLTDEQRQKISKASEVAAKAIEGLTKELNDGATRSSIEKRARAVRIEEQKQILAAITREQHQRWIAMLGERVDVSKLGRVKFKAPELTGQGAWINSTPLTMEKLKGKVVALHFYAFA